MAEMKTKANNASVDKFLSKVKDKSKREDCYKILELMKQVTKEEPKMWGPSIVGFGSYHYKYESGREGDMCLSGFSPRKHNLTIYIMMGVEKDKELIKSLGKFKSAKSCLYIKSLNDIDLKALKKLISNSVKYMKNKKWP